MANENSTIKDIVSNSSAGVKGPWIELIASVAADSNWVVIHIFQTNPGNVAAHAFFDIGVGASSSEVAKINNLAISAAGGSDFNEAGQTYYFPWKFSTGDRLAARIADTASSENDYGIQIRLFS